MTSSDLDVTILLPSTPKLRVLEAARTNVVFIQYATRQAAKHAAKEFHSFRLDCMRRGDHRFDLLCFRPIERTLWVFTYERLRETDEAFRDAFAEEIVKKLMERGALSVSIGGKGNDP